MNDPSLNPKLLAEIGWDITRNSWSPKQNNDDFSGVLLVGEENAYFQQVMVALDSFKMFSKFNYPVYLYINRNLVKSWGSLLFEISERYRLNVTEIDPITNKNDVNIFKIEFMTFDIPAENTLHFELDGFLIKSGWEDYVIDFDYIGAPFYECKQYSLLNSSESKLLPVGNGGFSFRKMSKMKEVMSRAANLSRWATHAGKRSYIPEDLFFSTVGFGYDIFKPVTIEQAKKFSLEPINAEQYRNKESFGFHKTI